MPSLNISMFNIFDHTLIHNFHCITYLYTLQLYHTPSRWIWARVSDLLFNKKVLGSRFLALGPTFYALGSRD